MAYIARHMEKKVLDLSKSFSALLITEPRQAGKTTMLKELAKREGIGRGYVSLDDLNTRDMAKNDPKLFLQLHKPPVIIDEVQYAPELFTYPASPHLAAKIDGRPIDLAHLIDCANKLAESYDVVLVEGAGGLAVPLTENLLTVDFVCAQNWPFVFVTSGRLGSINHAVLSLEALQRRGAELSAVIFNQCNPMPDATIEEDTREYIRDYLNTYFPQAGFQLIPCLP